MFLNAQNDGKISNNQYDVELQKDASIIINWKNNPSKKYQFYPRFIIMQREDDPKAGNVHARELIKDFKGAVSIPSWRMQGSNDKTVDFFKAAVPLTVIASSGKISGNEIKWTFPGHSDFRLAATISFLQGAAEPSIEYTFFPIKPAWYSIGYAGMPEMNLMETDAIWQPYIWQEKRFPQMSFFLRKTCVAYHQPCWKKTV